MAGRDARLKPAASLCPCSRPRNWLSGAEFVLNLYTVRIPAGAVWKRGAFRLCPLGRDG